MKTNTSNDNSDIIPSLSLSRRPGPPKHTFSNKQNQMTKEKQSEVKRPCIPIPSFQAERENLEKIFNDDSSSSDDSPRLSRIIQQPKKKKKKARPYIPIPSFSNSDDDDGFHDEDILSTKPIFTTESRKLEMKIKISSLNIDSKRTSNAPDADPNNMIVPTGAVEETNKESTSLSQPLKSQSQKEVQDIRLASASDIDDNNNNNNGAVILDSCSPTIETATDIQKRISESEVMQLAVGIARSLDPVKFNFKQVLKELQLQTGDALKHIKLPQLKQFILQQLEPSEEALHAAIDAVFLQTEVQSSTKKQFITKVQDMFAIPFSQQCRTKITRRLTSLLNKEFSPTVVAMTSHLAVESQQDPLIDNDCQIVACVTGTTKQQQQHSSLNEVSSGCSLSDTKIDKLSAQNCAIKVNDMEPIKAATGMPELPQGPGCMLREEVVVEKQQAHPLPMKEKKASTKTRKGLETRKLDVKYDQEITTKSSPIEKVSRKRKALCQLCVNCPCSLSMENSMTAPVFSEKHSAATIEKNLIKRLQKLEKITDYYEDQTESVRRTLKKHRREIWKKRESCLPDKKTKSRPRFLQDAGELGEVMNSIKPRGKIGSDRARKAQLTVFAHAPAPEQSTLTQLLYVTKPESGHDLEKPLDDIAEETEVDLKNETLQTSEHDDSDDGSLSRVSVASGEEHYFYSKPVPFSRIECSNGQKCIQSQAEDGGNNKSLWMSMLTGRWNQYLATLLENVDDGDESSTMDNLIEIIDESSVTGKSLSSVTQTNGVEFSMLSQRGQEIAQSLIQESEGDLGQSSMFKRQCPQWKENILFALHQKDADDIATALEQLRCAKSDLARKRDLVLQAIDDRTGVLNLYEKALEMSLSRLSKDSGQTDHQEYNSSSPTKPKSSTRLSLMSEAPTLRFTASQCTFSSPLSIASQ